MGTADASAPIVRNPTHPELKNLIPGGGYAAGITLHQRKGATTWYATYLGRVPPEIAAACEDKVLLQETRAKSWKGEGDVAAALSTVVGWLWRKHEMLTGEGMPGHVARDLAAEKWRLALA